MALAAFLMQPNPAPTALSVVVLDPHLNDRPDAAKGVDHHRDERPIAQTHDRRGVEASSESKSSRAYCCASTGVLPFRTVYLGPGTGAAGLVAMIRPTTNQSKSM